MDDLAAENRRLTAALADLERDHHLLTIRCRRLAEDLEHAEEAVRVWRRAAYRLSSDQPQET